MQLNLTENRERCCGNCKYFQAGGSRARCGWGDYNPLPVTFKSWVITTSLTFAHVKGCPAHKFVIDEEGTHSTAVG